MKNAMGSILYCKCIIYKKRWVKGKMAYNCKAWLKVMEKKYLRTKDCHHMSFSNGDHFRYSLQRKLCINCKPSKWYCPDYIQEDKKPNKKDKKRHSYWAIINYDFKLDIYFYEVLGNTNDKISQKVYIYQMFESIMKPWINIYHDFIWEEDSDISYGLGKSNIVYTMEGSQWLGILFQLLFVTKLCFDQKLLATSQATFS